jgi:outer membrane protein OmpA-like peptidoglycan-associated protein
MPDVRIGTYWVFCFDLNSRQILVDERIRRAIRSIKTHITPGASVEITGYADTRGNVEKNRKLSDDRAEAVLQLINVPLSKIANVEGKGESTIYDNDLPEGRLYNRFVRVDVRTPLERKR